jgi:hypothetical protein
MSETKEKLNLDDVISCIPKSRNHLFYWIDEGVLFETYQTIRGRRYTWVIEVPDMPDEERCTDECLRYIAKEYYL